MLIRINNAAPLRRLAQHEPQTLLLAVQQLPAPQVALYDHQGVFRFAGVVEADCLAYADLFALAAGSFTLAALEPCHCAQASRAGCSS